MQQYRLPDNIDSSLENSTVGSTVFCNSFLNGKEIAGILLVCNSILMTKLGIDEKEGLKYYPEFRNRMMKYHAWFNNFEMELIFENENSVRIHVHPYVKVFKDFLKMCIKNGYISVHFYNKDTTNVVSLHKEISDEEEMAWFIRSLAATKDVHNNTKYDTYFKDWQMDEMSESDKKRTHYFMFDRSIKSIVYKFKKN